MLDEQFNELTCIGAVIKLETWNNWFFDYSCQLGESLGIDYHKSSIPKYLESQARRKAQELVNVARQIHSRGLEVNIEKTLRKTTPEEVVRYEMNCGRFKWK